MASSSNHVVPFLAWARPTFARSRSSYTADSCCCCCCCCLGGASSRRAWTVTATWLNPFSSKMWRGKHNCSWNRTMRHKNKRENRVNIIELKGKTNIFSFPQNCLPLSFFIKSASFFLWATQRWQLDTHSHFINTTKVHLSYSKNWKVNKLHRLTYNNGRMEYCEVKSNITEQGNSIQQNKQVIQEKNPNGSNRRIHCRRKNLGNNISWVLRWFHALIQTSW